MYLYFLKVTPKHLVTSHFNRVGFDKMLSLHWNFPVLFPKIGGALPKLYSFLYTMIPGGGD